ncbi:MAG: transcriptional regulator GlxA family with amidase domain [Crocinitomix sp.]|jgi:transcriptional regulator GlxA family with amidase domain
MKHISIIVPNGEAILTSIISPYKIFMGVNGYLKQKHQTNDDFFKIDLVGISTETKLYNGAFSISPTKLITDIKKTDLIIVTTLRGDLAGEIENNRPFIPWIKEQRAKHNTEIASLCMGSFLLAETGLLDGQSCATHWMVADLFAEKYPAINVLPERIINENNGIYSSGGAFSILNLILYLVGKYWGLEAEVWCSKIYEIELDRHNQNQFAIFSGQKNHEDQPIIDAQRFIEENYHEKISIEQLANKFAISGRNFIRRFKKATANTPVEYIQRVKVEAAKKSLEMSVNSPITEVMYDVGYSDPKAFRNIFRKHTGLSPLEYKKKYVRSTT